MLSKELKEVKIISEENIEVNHHYNNKQTIICDGDCCEIISLYFICILIIIFIVGIVVFIIWFLNCDSDGCNQIKEILKAAAEFCDKIGCDEYNN